MSHTLHRRGTYEELQEDYVLLAMAATGFTHKGSAAVKKRMFEIVQEYPHVNCGEVKTGSLFNAKLEEILAGFEDTSVIHYVFVDKQVVEQVAHRLKQEDLGISVVITGLIDEIEDACNKAGLKLHTVEFSGGIMGRTERLPHQRILDITTMCGHGLISAHLVEDLLKKIKRGSTTIEDAAAELARPCICGVFNPKKAEKILYSLLYEPVPES
jgi:hypothetical protein